MRQQPETAAGIVDHDRSPAENSASELAVSAVGHFEGHPGKRISGQSEFGNHTPHGFTDDRPVGPPQIAGVSLRAAHLPQNPLFDHRPALVVTAVEQGPGAGIEFHVGFHPGLAAAHTGGDYRSVSRKVNPRTAPAAEPAELAQVARQRDRRVGIGHPHDEAAQQIAARNAVEAQTAEDIGAVGQHDHLPVGVGCLAHPEIRHPDIGDRMTMTFEIARRPTARRRESQFAAEPFADAGLRSPRVEGKAARSRSGLDRHDILAPFERVRQVEAHGGFAGADRLRRGKPANNQQQPSHPPPYANNSLTLAEISLPSARPASFFEATPITLPISFIDVAPTSAITALTSAASSSAVSCLGRNS